MISDIGLGGAFTLPNSELPVSTSLPWIFALKFDTRGNSSQKVALQSFKASTHHSLLHLYLLFHCLTSDFEYVWFRDPYFLYLTTTFCRDYAIPSYAWVDDSLTGNYGSGIRGAYYQSRGERWWALMKLLMSADEHLKLHLSVFIFSS